MKHRFLLVIPVADRPRQLAACLASLAALLRRFPQPAPVRVLIAEDSAEAAHVAAHRQIAAQFAGPGIETIHFGQAEQWALAAPLLADLPGVLGEKPAQAFWHKGQGAMRNLAYLKAAQLVREAPETLIWSLDADQEFRVALEPDEEHRIDYFRELDAIFSQREVEVLTGKVVGDPPVSPAVMTAHFLADLLGFLEDLAASSPEAPCPFHGGESGPIAEAAYHDMAERFGFTPAERYAYRCPLRGPHSAADGFAHFARRANSFFYGEHPTRATHYVPAAAQTTLQPARTVYAGNYVFRPTALKYFLPYAHLRLRMSGPTLGRLLRAELGPRFVSANLPLLHRRTVEAGGPAEFRPGIETQEARIDIADEFERQFYGDVMLFATERRLAGADFCEALEATREELLGQYNARQRTILARLALLEARLADPAAWWHGLFATATLRHFCANVRRNFEADGSGQARINDPTRWSAWRARLFDAVARHPAERTRWEAALATACGR